jgi:hypothetical protein
VIKTDRKFRDKITSKRRHYDAAQTSVNALCVFMCVCVCGNKRTAVVMMMIVLFVCVCVVCIYIKEKNAKR